MGELRLTGADVEELRKLQDVALRAAYEANELAADYAKQYIELGVVKMKAQATAETMQAKGWAAVEAFQKAEYKLLHPAESTDEAA